MASLVEFGFEAQYSAERRQMLLNFAFQTTQHNYLRETTSVCSVSLKSVKGMLLKSLNGTPLSISERQRQERNLCQQISPIRF